MNPQAGQTSSRRIYFIVFGNWDDDVFCILDSIFGIWLLYLKLLTIGLRVSLDGESGSSAEKARDDRDEAYLQSNHYAGY